MNTVNGKSAAQILNSYRDLFACNKDGSFKTGVGKTSGFIYADKTGAKKSATGIRAKSISNTQGNAQANREMRMELLQAFSACHASRKFLEFARTRLGLDAAGGIGEKQFAECSKPLSRRDVKSLLQSFEQAETHLVNKDSSARISFDSTTMSVDEKAKGDELFSDYVNVSFDKNAQHKAMDAYREYPTKLAEDAFAEGFGEEIDAKTGDNLTNIMKYCLKNGQLSEKTTLGWAMKAENDKNDLPNEVREDINNRKVALAKLLGQAEALCSCRNAHLSSSVSFLLTDARFLDKVAGNPQKLAALSRTFDKMTNMNIWGDATLPALYKKLNEILGTNTADIPQNTTKDFMMKAIDSMLDRVSVIYERQDRYDALLAECAFESDNLEDNTWDDRFIALAIDVKVGKNLEALPKFLGVLVKIALDQDTWFVDQVKSESELLPDLLDSIRMMNKEGEQATEFKKNKTDIMNQLRMNLLIRSQTSENFNGIFHKIIEDYRRDNQPAVNDQSEATKEKSKFFELTLAWLNHLGSYSDCKGEWQDVSAK